MRHSFVRLAAAGVACLFLAAPVFSASPFATQGPTTVLGSSASPVPAPRVQERSSAAERVDRLAAEASKRSTTYLTAVDDKGRVYSPTEGYVTAFPSSLKYALFAMFALASVMMYFLLTSGPSATVGSPGPISVTGSGDPSKTSKAPDSQGSPVPIAAQAPPKDAVHIRPADLRPISASHAPTWAELVRAAGGDPVRAASIIAGEVAADPSLPPDSDEAIARAWHRLLPRLAGAVPAG